MSSLETSYSFFCKNLNPVFSSMLLQRDRVDPSCLGLLVWKAHELRMAAVDLQEARNGNRGRKLKKDQEK